MPDELPLETEDEEEDAEAGEDDAAEETGDAADSAGDELSLDDDDEGPSAA